MSNSGLGYNVLNPRATFTTYLAAGKILGHKDDSVPTTEADSDDEIIAIWGNQTDDWIDQINQWVTGNAQAPGPVEIAGDIFLDAPSANDTIGDGTGAPSRVTDKGDTLASEWRFDNGGGFSMRAKHETDEDIRWQRWTGSWEDIERWDAVSGDVEIFNDVQLSSPSPLLRVGDASGIPKLWLTAGGNSNAYIDLTENAVENTSGFRLWYDGTANEGKIGGLSAGGVFQLAMTIPRDSPGPVIVHDGLEVEGDLFRVDGTNPKVWISAVANNNAYLDLTENVFENANGFRIWYDGTANLTKIGGLSSGGVFQLALTIPRDTSGPILVNDDLTLDSASPLFIVGDGSGSGEIYILADAAASGFLKFFKDSTAADNGDFRWNHTSGEQLILQSRMAGAWENAVSVTNADVIDFFGSAGSPDVAIGGGTGSPQLHLDKDPAGASDLLFRAASITRWNVRHDGSNNLLIQRRDAGGAFLNNVFQIRPDGEIRVANNAWYTHPNVIVEIGDGTGNPSQILNGVSGGTAWLRYQRGSGNRWRVGVNTSDDDFTIGWYNGSAVFQGDVLVISTTDGEVRAVQNFVVNGAAATFSSPSVVATLGDGTGSPVHVLDKLDAGTADVLFQNGGTDKWGIRVDSAEDLLFRRFTGGVFQDNALAIDDGTGTVTIANNLELDSASPTLAVGDGSGGNVSITLDSSAATHAQFIYKAGGALTWVVQKDATNSNLQFSRYNPTYQDDPLVIDNATGDVIVANDCSYTNPSVIVTLGDGTGSPSLVFDKSNGGGPRVFDFLNAGVRRYDLNFNSFEDLVYRNYDSGGVFTANAIVLQSNAIIRFEGAQVQLDTPSPILRIGDGSGTPRAYFDKLDTGTSLLDFLNEGVIRWRFYHFTDENLYVQQYDASGVFVENLLNLSSTTGSFTIRSGLTQLLSPSAILTVGDGTGNPKLRINKVGAGTTTYIELQVAGSMRWRIDFETSADIDFVSNTLGSVFRLDRTTGEVRIANDAYYSNPNVTVTLGDGLGNPELILDKAAGGAGGYLYWRNTGAELIRTGVDATDVWRLWRHNGASFDSFLQVTSAEFKVNVGSVFLADLKLLSGSPDLTVGDGTGVAEVLLNSSDGSQANIRLRSNGTSRWNIYRLGTSFDFAIRKTGGGDATVMQIDYSTIAVRFFGDLSLDSASPDFTIGDGTGGPDLVFNKDSFQTTRLFWLSNGNTRWQLDHDTNDDLVLKKISGEVVVTFFQTADLTAFAESVEIEGQFYSPQEDHTPAGTTVTIDFADGNMHMLDLGSASGNVTITLSNPEPGATYVITIDPDPGGSNSLVWPATVLWPGGTEPDVLLATPTVVYLTYTEIAAGGRYLGIFGEDLAA